MNLPAGQGASCRDSDRRIQWPWEVSDSKYGGRHQSCHGRALQKPRMANRARRAAQKWRRAYLDECQEREWAEKKLKTYEEDAKKRLIPPPEGRVAAIFFIPVRGPSL